MRRRKVLMDDYKHFKTTILKAKASDIIPRYSETVYIGDGKDCDAEFTTWDTKIAQAVAEATTLGELKEDEEMIVIIKRHKKDGDE
jgi:hypothetical protein